MYRFEDYQPDILRTESGGDYNALFGYQNRPGGRFENVQVTNMTIGDILDFQNPRGAYGQYVAGARPDRERGVATPVGAYQIVGTTLRDAVRALGLPLDTKFTPEVQDQVARYIFETQGPQAWQGLNTNQTAGQTVADATMAALGRGGDMNGSTGLLNIAGGQQAPLDGQPRSGTFQAQQPQQRQPFFGPDFLDRLTIGLEGLSMRPNEALIQMAQGSIQQRREAERTNRTVEELRRRNRNDLANMVEAGVLTGADAAKILFQQPERTAAQQNYEYLVAQGMDPEEAMRRAFSTGTTIDLGEQETEMAKGFGRGIAEETNQIIEAGRVASRSLGQIETLDYALQEAPQGVFGNIAGIANRFGIPLSDDMTELQIADAIISQLVPQQRPPGSGPMSDADLELFKRSLPRLANTPEGNRMIVATMRALAEYDIARADIASQLRLGYITPQEANELYGQLPNPVAPFVELQRQSGQPAAVDPAAATDELERLLGGS